MRLTLVSETYLPQVNGVSRTLSYLVSFLRERGDTVQLIHPDYGQPSESADDVRVRSVALPFYRDVLVPLPPFGAVHRRIAEFAPDIIHIATEATLGLSVLRFARRAGIPLVSSFHTNFDEYSRHYHLGWARGTIWRYLRWFHNATRETYVPSRVTIDDLTGRGFERLVLWPRGVDATLFRPDRPGRAAIRAAWNLGPEDILIGHVSRLAHEKNVTYLGAALRQVLEARPRAHVLVVGDGPSRGELEGQLGPRARFVGFQSGQMLADHYAAADLFAFASKTETFGNVVLEALSSGLPVVALGAGGVASIVESGQTGVLVEPEAPPDQFASQIIGLIDDQPRRREMGHQARCYAERQTWSAINERLRDRYQQAAMPRGASMS